MYVELVEEEQTAFKNCGNENKSCFFKHERVPNQHRILNNAAGAATVPYVCKNTRTLITGIC